MFSSTKYFIGFLFALFFFNCFAIADTLPTIIVSSAPTPPGELVSCTCNLNDPPYNYPDGTCVDTCVSCSTCYPNGWGGNDGKPPVVLNGCGQTDCTDEPPVEPPTKPFCEKGTTQGKATASGEECVQDVCKCNPEDPSQCGFESTIVDKEKCAGTWEPSPSPKP